MSWTCISISEWRRRDGARVWQAENGRSDGMDWVAASPEGIQLRRQLRSDRAESFTPVRRFGSSAAARRTIDREFPLQASLQF